MDKNQEFVEHNHNNGTLKAKSFLCKLIETEQYGHSTDFPSCTNLIFKICLVGKNTITWFPLFIVLEIFFL